MTHFDYLEQYLISHTTYSTLTIKAYRSDLRQMKKCAVDWSVKSLQIYFDQLVEQHKPATAMRRYHALMALGNELVRSRRLRINPMRHVRSIVHQHVKQRDSYPLTDAIDVIRHMDHPTYRLFFELISQTGLRFMEARLLSVEDIQVASSTLLVRHGKGRRLRTIPIGRGLVDKLKRFLAGRMSGLIFQSHRGKAINEQAARAALSRQSRLMSGRTLHPHDLRVAYATYLYQTAGCTLIEIQRLLGHSSSVTTEGYILSQETKLRQIVETLSA